MQTKKMLRRALAAVVLCMAGAAHAQPTAEQQNAIRSSCRSDFMSNCSSVTPGGAEAMQCLQRNLSKLSPACHSAVSAISPKPAAPAATAPAAAPPPAAAAPPAATPAPAASAPAASPSPAPAASAPAPEKPAAVASPPAARPAAPAAAPPPAAAAPPADLPPRAELMIARACALERRTVCDIPAGGGRIIACLAANEAKLTPRCKLTLQETRSMR